MIVKLSLHDGTNYEENIEGFNLADFIEQINTEQHKMIQFGAIGVMKTQIKLIDSSQPEPEVIA